MVLPQFEYLAPKTIGEVLSPILYVLRLYVFQKSGPAEAGPIFNHMMDMPLYRYDFLSAFKRILGCLL